MYGFKAMNLLLCFWLWARCPVRPWVMFHEVAFPVGWKQPLRHNLLGATTRLMASLVIRAAARIFVAIPAWEQLLRRLTPVRAPVTWLPVPSNVALEASPEVVAAVRNRIAADGNAVVLGHFGTFGGQVAEEVARVLPPLLTYPRRVALLVGRGSAEFAERFL